MIDLRNLLGRFGRKVDLVDLVRFYRGTPGPVLSDLADFCGAVDPAPRSADIFSQGRAAGRRDVWLRIQHHLGLEAPEVYALLKGEYNPKEWKGE